MTSDAPPTRRRAMPEGDPSAADGGDLDRLVQDLGERVRALRQRSELTLHELGQRTGLSLSMLSAVERGKTSPSLATLHALAQGLGVPLTELFTRHGGAESPITRAEDLIVDETDGGMIRRTAVYRADYDLEVYVDEWQPGTSHARTPSQHPGHEVGIILEGVLEIELEHEAHEASSGDVAQFSGRRPHLIKNAGRTVARAVWINLRRL